MNSSEQTAMRIAVSAASAGRRVSIICSTVEQLDRLVTRYGSAGGLLQYIVCPNDAGYTHVTDAVVDVRGMAEKEVARG